MKTILLIEDHDDIRENTAEILEMAGYRVLTAENGKAGVEKALETRPDLVVCDIMMPVLDGYGVLHIFNQNPRLAGVPFIFLTAKTERADLRRGMELGADDYLTKPFDDSELLSAVAGRLARFQHLRPDYPATAAGVHDFLADAGRADGLDALVADRRPHVLPRRHILYAEGDEATRLYFVQSGRVKVSKTTAAGKELITALLGPGEFLGYQALLAGTAHHDTAVTLDEAAILYIPATDFSRLLLRHPEVSRRFVRLLVGQVQQQAGHRLELAYSSLRRRVADTLLHLHAQQQQLTPADPRIPLGRDDMAALIGTAPESLSRTLSEFRQGGILDVAPGYVHLLHPEKLRSSNW
ncbi:response regulator [Hymenobacter sp. NST-14]|uniref:response regulator n=1 Tax=Hymenobacter piscis TaxID=2839984 RepID=UPI001C034D60|nr:response regulator [Hymenobacter piscis]MBT9394916.1 response regulator [Hymenobacter piscis]